MEVSLFKCFKKPLEENRGREERERVRRKMSLRGAKPKNLIVLQTSEILTRQLITT